MGMDTGERAQGMTMRGVHSPSFSRLSFPFVLPKESTVTSFNDLYLFGIRGNGGIELVNDAFSPLWIVNFPTHCPQWFVSSSKVLFKKKKKKLCMYAYLTFSFQDKICIRRRMKL